MSKKKRILKGIFLVLGILAISGAVLAYFLYQMILANNVSGKIKSPYSLYIKTNSNYQSVIDSLEKNHVLIDVESFDWVCDKKNYKNKIKSGRYEIKAGMSNNEIVNMLRSGNQKPVKLTFNSIRTKNELAGKIGPQLEFDSLDFVNLLNNKSYLKKFGFTSETILCMFIPNTYQVYWNESPESFFEKMNKEYKKFWTPEREQKLKRLNMNKLEVSTLASIVQAEQSVRNDEKPMVAGVYINRIKQGMLLESCPTLIFAMGDFSIRRVLNKDKEIESPYNTYKNPGLPPGPINLPEISSIDAVLNYKKHDYLFMCAKDDFSGYHYFSTTFSQHNVYAHRYQLALNKRKIKR